jgi:hypothetical protein
VWKFPNSVSLQKKKTTKKQKKVETVERNFEQNIWTEILVARSSLLSLRALPVLRLNIVTSRSLTRLEGNFFLTLSLAI